MPQIADANPSDSRVQHEIESAILDRLGKLHPDWQRVAWKTEAAELGLPTVWQRAEPDATWKTGSGQIIVAECYVRIGELKSGHRRKLAMDALKLLALRHALPDTQHIRFLIVVPDELADRLNGGGWFPVGIRCAADIVRVALLESEQRSLGETTGLQAQGQARTARPRKERSRAITDV